MIRGIDEWNKIVIRRYLREDKRGRQLKRIMTSDTGLMSSTEKE